MGKVLQRGLHTFKLVRWDTSDQPGPTLEFRDRSAALDFLYSFFDDPSSLFTLREVFAEELAYTEIVGWDDQEVLDQLAWRLVSGQIKVIRDASSQPSVSAGLAAQVMAPEAPAGTPLPPTIEASTPPSFTRKIDLQLVTDDGYPIPEAAFRIECEGGATQSGTLDRQGCRTVHGLPHNTAFAVYYPEEDDIRAKAFAARLDDGLSQASPEMVLGVLMQPASDLRAVADLLERYFEGPMAERCRAVFKSHECLPVVENLLARADLFDGLMLIQYDEGR